MLGFWYHGCKTNLRGKGCCRVSRRQVEVAVREGPVQDNGEANEHGQQGGARQIIPQRPEQLPGGTSIQSSIRPLQRLLEGLGEPPPPLG